MTFYEGLSAQEKAKALVLFQRMAELGPAGLQNREKFKFLETRSREHDQYHGPQRKGRP
jgi:hypothetical protein